MRFLAAIVVFVVLASALAALALVPRYIFGPLDRAAKGRRYPVQFTLADFFCLFVLMQIAMALGHSWPEIRGTGTGWVVTVYGWIGFGLLWLAHVRKLSRAGVHKGWLRAVCLVFVVPAGCIVSVVTPIWTGVVFGALNERERVDFFALWLGVEVALLVAVYLLGRCMRHIIAKGAVAEGDSEAGSMVE